MRMLAILLATLLALLAANAAEALTPNQRNLILNAAPNGPLDIAPGAGIACGMRRQGKNYAGALINLRNNGSGALQNIYPDWSGWLPTGFVIAFLGSNGGFVDECYDESGNAHHLTQATTNLQPQLSLNATIVGRPSMVFTGGEFLATAATIGGAYPQTYYAVFSSNSGDTGFEPIVTIDSGTNGAQLQTSTGPMVGIAAASGPAVSISSNTFYAAIGVLASSLSATIYVNGTSASSAPGALGAAAVVRIAHSTDGFFTNFTGSISEVGLWLAVPSGPTAIISNEKAAYGTH